MAGEEPDIRGYAFRLLEKRYFMAGRKTMESGVAFEVSSGGRQSWSEVLFEHVQVENRLNFAATGVVNTRSA